MPSPEHRSQIDMFTGETVDTRTEAQKRRDRERAQPQQAAMFSPRETIEQARSKLPAAPMVNRRGERLELHLMVQDPRTEEEVEADRMKAAQEMTKPMFGEGNEKHPESGVSEDPPEASRQNRPPSGQEPPGKSKDTRRPEPPEAETRPAAPLKTTPVYQQYSEIKKQFPQAILFFRLGDFYEAFNEDAEIIARELDIVLTSRHISKGQRVSMAGVPHRVVDNYVTRLIQKGYHVAVADQIGDEPVNGLIPRGVNRVFVPEAKPAEVDKQASTSSTLPEQSSAEAAPTAQPGESMPAKPDRAKSGQLRPSLGRTRAGMVILFDSVRMLLPL